MDGLGSECAVEYCESAAGPPTVAQYPDSPQRALYQAHGLACAHGDYNLPTPRSFPSIASLVDYLDTIFAADARQRESSAYPALAWTPVAVSAIGDIDMESDDRRAVAYARDILRLPNLRTGSDNARATDRALNNLERTTNDLAVRANTALKRRCGDLAVRIEANRVVGSRVEAKIETLSRYFEQLLTLERIRLPHALEPVFPAPPPVYQRRQRGDMEIGEVAPYLVPEGEEGNAAVI